jgi:hypothetical protein
MVYDGFALIDTSGHFTFWRGNTPWAYDHLIRRHGVHYDWPFESLPVYVPGGAGRLPLVKQVRRRYDVDEPSDLQICEYALQQTILRVRTDPDRFLRNARYKIIDMWNPTSFLLRHYVLGGYGKVNPVIRNAVSWAAVISYLLVVLLGLIGMLMRWRDSRVWFVALMILFHTSLSVAAFGLTRFRMPVMPFLILLAALPVCAVHSRLAAHHDRTD